MFQFLKQTVRLSLLRRFIASVQEDGWRIAIAKSRQYLGMLWQGSWYSSLANRSADTPDPDHHYLTGIWSQLAQGEAFHIAAPALSSNKRSIALIGDLNLAQCRKYRVEQLAAFWEAQGVRFRFSHYQDLPRATRILSEATHLFEYRLQSTPLTEMFRYEARRLRLPVLYDIDDPLFSVSAYETYGNMKAIDPWFKGHFLSEAPKYLTMMNGADILSMSTPGLVDHARQYSTRPIYLRRNFADQEALTAGRRAMRQVGADRGAFTVAFASGSQGHEADLEIILPALATFVDAAPARRLLILGHFNLSRLPPQLAERTDTVPFSGYDAYLTALARSDCAIMPLADDPFNRCKSAVRVIDAASVGVPSIVGPVGDMAQMIKPGETGFVASDPGDWLRRLEELASDAARAAAMGHAAREDLETRWIGAPADHIISPDLLAWVRE